MPSDPGFELWNMGLNGHLGPLTSSSPVFWWGSAAGKSSESWAQLPSSPPLDLIALFLSLSKTKHIHLSHIHFLFHTSFSHPATTLRYPESMGGGIASSGRPAVKPSSPGVRRPSTSNPKTSLLTARREWWGEQDTRKTYFLAALATAKTNRLTIWA